MRKWLILVRNLRGLGEESGVEKLSYLPVFRGNDALFQVAAARYITLKLAGILSCRFESACSPLS